MGRLPSGRRGEGRVPRLCPGDRFLSRRETRGRIRPGRSFSEQTGVWMGGREGGGHFSLVLGTRPLTTRIPFETEHRCQARFRDNFRFREGAAWVQGERTGVYVERHVALTQVPRRALVPLAGRGRMNIGFFFSLFVLRRQSRIQT